jgi:hypothetical protein
MQIYSLMLFILRPASYPVCSLFVINWLTSSLFQSDIDIFTHPFLIYDLSIYSLLFASVRFTLSLSLFLYLMSYVPKNRLILAPLSFLFFQT